MLQLLSVSTAVAMNTQYQETIKAIPYEVVFGTSPSSEPVPELHIIDEQGEDKCYNMVNSIYRATYLYNF